MFRQFKLNHWHTDSSPSQQGWESLKENCLQAREKGNQSSIRLPQVLVPVRVTLRIMSLANSSASERSYSSVVSLVCHGGDKGKGRTRVSLLMAKLILLLM